MIVRPGSVVEPDWHGTEEGRAYSGALLRRAQRRSFGEVAGLKPWLDSALPRRAGGDPGQGINPASRSSQRGFSPSAGLIERPVVAPQAAADVAGYKVFVSGKSGVGKTALVAKLAGLEVPLVHHETTGDPRFLLLLSPRQRMLL